MSTYKSFKEAKVWQESRKLNIDLFSVLSEKSKLDVGFLVNHLFKTAGSVMDNIAEGFEREGNKELIYFLAISKGSAGELQSQLIRANDFGIVSDVELERLNESIDQILKQLSNFIRYLKQSKIKGNKFKEPKSEYMNQYDENQFFT